MGYKVYYFDVIGIADQIRLLLAYSGKEFEDVRLQPAEWPNMKPTLENRSLPILGTDRGLLCGSIGIMRLLAFETDLMPLDPFDRALCDEYSDDFMGDLIGAFHAVLPLSDQDLKAKVFVTIKEKKIFPRLDKFNKLLESKTYLVGDKLSWVDFTVFNMHYGLIKWMELNYDDYPGLKKHRDTLLALPAVKEFLDKHPNVRFHPQNPPA